jgi:two-component system OmpR family response regulator
VMLTARGQSIDRISGLEIGADAYMVKPVELRELEAQVRTLLRRLRTSGMLAAASAAPVWAFEPVTWRLVAPSGAAVRLTSAECRFLSLLTRHPAQPVSRAEVFRMLGKRQWEAGDRSVDSLVRRLRVKVRQKTGESLPVQSVHAIVVIR